MFWTSFDHFLQNPISSRGDRLISCEFFFSLCGFTQGFQRGNKHYTDPRPHPEVECWLTERSLEDVLLPRCVCVDHFYFLCLCHLTWSRTCCSVSDHNEPGGRPPRLCLNALMMLSYGRVFLPAACLQPHAVQLSRVIIGAKTLILKCWLRGKFYLIKHQTNRIVLSDALVTAEEQWRYPLALSGGLTAD